MTKPTTESLQEFNEQSVSIDGIVSSAIRLVMLEKARRKAMQKTTFTRAWAKREIEPFQAKIVRARADLESSVSRILEQAEKRQKELLP